MVGRKKTILKSKALRDGDGLDGLLFFFFCRFIVLPRRIILLENLDGDDDSGDLKLLFTFLHIIGEYSLLFVYNKNQIIELMFIFHTFFVSYIINNFLLLSWSLFHSLKTKYIFKMVFWLN